MNKKNIKNKNEFKKRSSFNDSMKDKLEWQTRKQQEANNFLFTMECRKRT